MSVKQIFNTSAELDYPKVLPTLDLDFANSKTLDPRITFTRASGGSYVGADGLIKLAGVNEPRFDHDPYTGESLGFLVEEARTNLRTASVDFSTGWTFNSNVTVASGQTSPTGDSTASLVTAAAGTLRARLGENFVTSSSIVYTRSWFVKKTNQRYIWCGDQNAANYSPNYRFDLDLGVGVVSSDYFSFNRGFSITPFANGYYRISVSCISQDIWTIVANNDSSLNPLVTTYTHDGTETFIIWGYQIEAGEFPTSYIPTVASTRTRAADTASITGTNFRSWYNQSEGTLAATFTWRAGVGYQFAWGIYQDGSNEVYVGNWGSASQTLGVRFNNNQVTNSTAYIPNTGINIVCKTATAMKSNNFSVVSNASTPVTYTGAALASNMNELFIMNLHTGYQLNGTISRLTYYPKRLTDAQLQTLTT